MGAGYVAREALRRLLGRPYAYNGITVRDDATFHLLRKLSGVGEVWAEGGLVYFRNRLGVFSAPRLDMFLMFLEEDLEEVYGALDVGGRTVADVGAYLGETAVLFARRGAGRIYAYEPVFYRYVARNLRLNNVTNAVVEPYGLWFEEDELSVEPAGAGTGLTPGGFVIRVRPLGEALTRADVVKMDCEGCEWSLITTPCDVVRHVEEYVIEVHGPSTPVVRKMEKCGYRPMLLGHRTPLLSTWHFRLLTSRVK
jgi:FkbM family methyltransferase